LILGVLALRIDPSREDRGGRMLDVNSVGF
jgi:hypothetical protein